LKGLSELFQGNSLKEGRFGEIEQGKKILGGAIQ